MIASPRYACTEPGRQRTLLEHDSVRDTADERAGSDQLSPAALSVRSRARGAFQPANRNSAGRCSALAIVVRRTTTTVSKGEDGFQDNTRLFLPATAFDRFAVTREINDGLLAPRFAPSQRAWILVKSGSCWKFPR